MYYIFNKCQVFFKEITRNFRLTFWLFTMVWRARIRALRSKDQGWQNVPEQWRGNVQTEGLREAK
jgi:hypothetical protein